MFPKLRSNVSKESSASQDQIKKPHFPKESRASDADGRCLGLCGGQGSGVGDLFPLNIRCNCTHAWNSSLKAIYHNIQTHVCLCAHETAFTTVKLIEQLSYQPGKPTTHTQAGLSKSCAHANGARDRVRVPELC